ncbi:MAG: ImmA/IrrE family metallo-endopeptidase [Desulfobacteraceae bacterium]|jgi:HTH-type transcriptional regulator/antitoxin HigA|nr:ImmA/IrrE family metallo-endopeptidase [Desulfobacteraceae bacterium]
MPTAKKQYEFEPDYAIAPGETLKETMESLNMGQKELAVRTGLTVQSLDRIFKGEQPISYETANKLELVTGVPARMWNNLEAQYREQLAKIKERKHLEADLEWLKTIPTKELVQRMVIEPVKDKVILLREALKFYGVSSVKAWEALWMEPAVAARRSQCFETCPGTASAWIRMGEIQAHQINCQPYDKNRFKKALVDIRMMTVKDPGDFIPAMVQLCADTGVAVVLVREMKKVPWHGATKWLAASKAMILLNLRGKSEDQFWFSFFHEAGHVLNDSKKDVYINDGKSDNTCEQKANDFAAEILIPQSNNPEIAVFRTKAQVIDLANKLNLSPGIVAGRYQRLTGKWDLFNGLKRKFQWAGTSE